MAHEIVPDDFPGLDKMKNEYSETEGDDMPACPQCDGVVLAHRTGGTRQAHDQPKSEWYCRACNYHFDEPK